ncbi:MAG TPA: hypothetical protein VF129_09680 [Actinomycetota bacterium]
MSRARTPGLRGEAQVLVKWLGYTAGLSVASNGTAIMARGIGLATPEQLLLAQVAATRSGRRCSGPTEVVTADLLEELRDRAGWSITTAREAEAATYQKQFGYVPAFLQTDEAYATYKDRARSNYQTMTPAG